MEAVGERITRLLLAMALFLSAGFLSSSFLLLDSHLKSRSVCAQGCDGENGSKKRRENRGYRLKFKVRSDSSAHRRNPQNTHMRRSCRNNDLLFQTGSPSPCFRSRAFASPTSVSGVEGSEGDHEEGGGVFPCVHQVREGSLGVSVTAQALDETEPGGQTLDDGT